MATILTDLTLHKTNSSYKTKNVPIISVHLHERMFQALSIKHVNLHCCAFSAPVLTSWNNISPQRSG